MPFKMGDSQSDSVVMVGIPEEDKSSSRSALTAIATISNGLCRFNPMSKKGKWVFLAQTIFLSFSPMIVLLIQNGVLFNAMLIKKAEVMQQYKLVNDLSSLATFVLDLQRERSAVALNLFTFLRTMEPFDVSKEFAATEKTLNEMEWRKFGQEKIFSTKLRFQIKLDDFREFITQTKPNDSRLAATDEDVMNFYNLATGRLLASFESGVGKAQRSNNWRLMLTYFNMIKILENIGVSLIYGLRYYGNGKLTKSEMITYVQHHALVAEYLRQVKEFNPADIQEVLDDLYTGELFGIVNSSFTQILANVEVEAEVRKAVDYFEGCSRFGNSLLKIMEMLKERILRRANEELYDANLAQLWGVFLLIVVLLISPMLVVLAKNAISTIQIFASSVELKAIAMKKQQTRQNKLIYKMLPKIVVNQLKTGGDVAETFESASFYFSAVVDFDIITNNCTATQVVQLLNDLYSVMDDRMDSFDVYKVETISDTYLVASGVPKKNGDKHASEICAMALHLVAASAMVARPDIRPTTIQLRVGIHTGAVVAGVVGNKMPRYCLFGDSISMASKMQKSSLPGKIQISAETKLYLDMAGGFLIEDRGKVEITGKRMQETHWLVGHNHHMPKSG